MTIEEQFTAKLKEAMRSKDQKVLDVVRQIKTRVKERQVSKGFSGPVDDKLWQDIIQQYCKQMQKAIPEYAGAGEQGKPMIAKLEFEIAFLKEYLPKKMDPEETKRIIGEAITQLRITDKSKMGMLMGHLMKTYKDQMDPALAKEIINQLLP